MTEVVSIRFKNRGKAYYFDPAGLQIQVGDSVIVDTANGMEIAVCSRENHPVEDTAVVQPLRRVLRIATQMDLRTEELNRQREKSAFEICREKIQEHSLDMKLVDVECNFEGSKTTFFFTSDGRVDFRSLVKDLAGILHNRIELRQIGVRDEAKMLGGLGICGRPYCCNQFLDDFHPVSTKMAKIQSLSLNPAKISGSCGRLMCCLRYEQEAYEDLVKKVPKQGAFVETKDGYGTAVQVNLLRSRAMSLRRFPADVRKTERSPLMFSNMWNRSRKKLRRKKRTSGPSRPWWSHRFRKRALPHPRMKPHRKRAGETAGTAVVTRVPSPPPTPPPLWSPSRKRPSSRNLRRAEASAPVSASGTPRRNPPAPAEASDGGKSEKKNGKPRRRHYHGKKPSGKPASES